MTATTKRITDGERDAEVRLKTLSDNDLKLMAELLKNVADSRMSISPYNAAFANRMLRAAREKGLI